MWSGNDGTMTQAQPTILGKTSDDSLDYLAGFFSEDVERLCVSWRMSQTSNVRRVFNEARYHRIIGTGDITRLKSFTEFGTIHDRARKAGAVKAYNRKWIESRKFEWGQSAQQPLFEIHARCEADISLLNQMYSTSSTRVSNTANSNDIPARSSHGGSSELSHCREYTIRSGYSLWSIAGRTYGNPALYTKIFEANRDKIEDPDLIYPGMQIVIPTIQRGL